MFGIQRTAELLIHRVDRIFWYSPLDLPPPWEATTRHKESEGSSYYQHFYMGLIRADNTPKPAAPSTITIRPWGSASGSTVKIPRMDLIIEWLRKLKVKKLRTGISWADWHRPHAVVAY